MKRSAAPALILALAICPGLAYAGRCGDVKSMDTACLKAEDVRLTIEINELYSKLLAESDGLRRGFLEMAKRSWSEYAKSQCIVEWDLSRTMHDDYSRVGTVGTDDNMRCLIRHKELRLAELKSIRARSVSAKKK